MLTEYHKQLRQLSVGQSLTGYPVNKEWHHHTMSLKCTKQVQAKRWSCSGCLLLRFFWSNDSKGESSEVKVYGCWFVCMATRACHLELVDDLSTDHFIMALKRFTARRGRPQRIYSDNGINFLGADNELLKRLKKLNEHKVQNVCAPTETEWNFQAASAPHFGGAWERLVQSTKKNLKSVLQNRIFAKEALRAALVEAEGILNSRPVTYVVQRGRSGERRQKI